MQGIDEFLLDKELLHPILSECRVHKSDLEVELLRHVNKISSEAHVQVDLRRIFTENDVDRLKSLQLSSLSWQCTCTLGFEGLIILSS